jgi:hypothetical protein
MRFKPLTGLFLFIFCMGCGSATALTSTETAGCEAEPTSLPPANQRWAFRIDRATGQKCWFFVARHYRFQQPTQPISLFDNPFEPESAEKAPADCLVERTGLAPHAMQWRVRVERESGRKCWVLVRKPINVAKPVSSVATKYNAIDESYKMAAQQGALIGPQLPESQSNASTNRKEAASPGGPAQSWAAAFQSRWDMVANNPSNPMKAIARPSASLDSVAGEMGEESDAALPSTRSVRSSGYQTLVVAALSLAAVIFALYSFTGGALDWIRRARARSQNISSDRADSGSVSSPPTTPGISDILDRLQTDELNNPAPPNSNEGAGLPKHMRERRSVYSKPKRIKDRRMGARRVVVPVPDEPHR